MRRSRLIYAAALIACIVFSVLYKSRISAVLLFTVLGYIPLALVSCAVCLLCFKAGFADRRGIYRKNTPFDIRIIVANRTIFACAPVELVCELADRETGLFAEKRVYVSLPPLGRCRVAVSCLHRYRGCYTAKITRIAAYDPLRIIRLSRRLDEKMTQIFLPRRISSGELAADTAGESSAAPSKLLSCEKEDFSHVRSYHSGDLVQLVHWKLTAKTDEVMIKQFDEMTDRRILILCDYNTQGSGEEQLQRADQIIETAVSFALSAAEAGVKAAVDFGANDRSFYCEISDMTEFNRFFELMSVLPAKLDICAFSELIEENADSGASVLFLVTPHLTHELIAQADALAESFSGIVILALADLTESPLAYEAENSRFIFLNIHGDPESGIPQAIAELEERRAME